MRKARIYVHGVLAGYLEEQENAYKVEYLPSYAGVPISMSLPIQNDPYIFNHFPAFFEGLLLEGLLRNRKLSQKDYFGQILAVGGDLVGSVTVEESL